MIKAHFYQETTPQPSVDYFTPLDEHGEKMSPSKIATVTVFYNEGGHAMEKTMKCLNVQQNVQEYGHDLLLVGDGLQHMTASMADYLKKVYSFLYGLFACKFWQAFHISSKSTC